MRAPHGWKCESEVPQRDSRVAIPGGGYATWLVRTGNNTMDQSIAEMCEDRVVTDDLDRFVASDLIGSNLTTRGIPPSLP